MYKIEGYDSLFSINGERGTVFQMKQDLRANCADVPTKCNESVWTEKMMH